MLTFINEKDNVLLESLQGMIAAQPDELVSGDNTYSYVLRKKKTDKSKVQIITNGGAGLGPMFMGFVGEGLADAAISGDFDCAPNAFTLYETAKELSGEKGVLLIANHFTGDYLNNDLAQELLLKEGVPCKVCLASDDMFSAAGEEKECRGGLSGVGMLIKIAASAAKKGCTLEEVYAITQKANKRLRSLSVLVDEGACELEFGTGFSGESAVFTAPYSNVRDMAARAVEYLAVELNKFAEHVYYICVNRTSKITYIEGYIILAMIREELEKRGGQTGGCAVGSYFDVYEKKGCIISVLAANRELADYMEPVSGYDFTI